MDDMITQLGVGGIFALMILDRVFTYVSKKKNSVDDYHLGCRMESFDSFHGAMRKDLQRLEHQIERLSDKLDKSCKETKQ